MANANLADGSVDARTLGPASVTSAALAVGAVGTAARLDGRGNIETTTVSPAGTTGSS